MFDKCCVGVVCIIDDVLRRLKWSSDARGDVSTRTSDVWRVLCWSCVTCR
jgi:hypothetical protein